MNIFEFAWCSEFADSISKHASHRPMKEFLAALKNILKIRENKHQKDDLGEG